MTRKKTAPKQTPPPPADGAINFRDRIVDFKRMKASDLKANAQNWRLHPDSQKGAMTGMLNKVGFVDAIITRKLPTGELEIINGHLRQDISGDALVPVIITDLNDEEAKMVLATFDPLSTMAITSQEMLAQLMEGLTFDDDAELRRLMEDTMEKIVQEEGKSPANNFEVPGMGLQPHEHYDYIVVLASTTHEWNVLCDRLGLVPEKRRNRMGTCRALRATKLLDLLPAREDK